MNKEENIVVSYKKNIKKDKARPMQMGLDRGKAAQSRKTASRIVHKKK